MTGFHHNDTIRSWGRVLKVGHEVANPGALDDLTSVLDEARERGITVLGHGLGRSYGDSNLNPDNGLVLTRRLDRFIAFEPETGTLRAEAGVSLGEIMQLVVPSGHFLHTTPGTRYVTLGGAIANDVHGKNHHKAGSFAENLMAFGLIRSDRGEVTVTRETEPELFHATVGGLGLTGLISWAEIRLVPIRSAFIHQEMIPFDNLDGFFDIMAHEADRFEHTVAWVDCTASGTALGRGVFTGGNWASNGPLEAHREGGPRLPIDAPGFALNPLTLKSFNTAYNWWQNQKPRTGRVHYPAHFHPLDAIREWNRLYGSNGFYQYQSVIPHAAGRDATRDMLARIAASGQGSMLAVLKTFGGKGRAGALSFPQPGVTLALDIQNQGQRTLDLMANLDDIVRSAGGRLYPAKDGRIPADLFQVGFPDWQEVERLRDPRITSAFWQRVTAS